MQEHIPYSSTDQTTPWQLAADPACKISASTHIRTSERFCICSLLQAPAHSQHHHQAAAVRPRALRRQHSSRLRCTAVAAEQKTEAPGLNLLKWLKEKGAPQDKVELRTLDVPAAGEFDLLFL